MSAALHLAALHMRAARAGLELRAQPDGGYAIGHAKPSFEPIATVPSAAAARDFVAQVEQVAAEAREFIEHLLLGAAR